MRIAWFSPLPPDPSGIAAYTTEIAPLLAPSFEALDLYIRTAWPPAQMDADEARRTDLLGITRARLRPLLQPPSSLSVESAHDFVWRHRRQPYDLIVYHLGNSSAHDYMWAYLFRYPGLLVLHDAQVHQARALWLLRRLEPRLDDYLAEVQANHPGSPAPLGHLFAAGLGGHLYRQWPMVSLVIRASRMTVVHSAHLAERLRREHPGAPIRHLEMGVADGGMRGTTASDEVRMRHGIPRDACVIGAFGGLTPEKRIPELLEAVARSPRTDLHVMLVGQPAAHYDVMTDVRRRGLEARGHVPGYVADEDLPAYMAAADVCWCLRWPSNGETSASWLRCLAAGKPTVITALAQLRDVPALAVNADGVAAVSTNVHAVAIAIDPADERREIAHALEALAGQASLRATLGTNARQRWQQRHTLPRMADGYGHRILEAAGRPAPVVDLPAHLRDDGTGTLRRILSDMGRTELPW